MITAGMMELRLLASFRTLVTDRCPLEISQSNSTEPNMHTSMPIRYGRELKYEFYLEDKQTVFHKILHKLLKGM